MNDYEERCYSAAVGQDLTYPALKLASAGYYVSVDQTGGFTMCLNVLIPPEHELQTTLNKPYLWVTHDGPKDQESGPYIVGLYDDSEEGACEGIRNATTIGPYLVETVAAFFTRSPHFDGENWRSPVDGHVLDADECQSADIDPGLRDR